MAKTIKAIAGLADFTLGSTPVSYKTMLDVVDFSSESPVEEETTFDNEAVGGEVSVGTPVNLLELEGFIRYDGPNTAPFLPLSAFQDKPFVLTYVTGCTVTGVCSFFRSRPGSRAGRSRRLSAAARVIGGFTFAWDETAPS